ncbi:MAG: condensation domain-containing protein, partial [Clostridiales bacterium]
TEDIANLEKINEKLKEVRNTEIVMVSKASFGKEAWICSCGKKVDINSDYFLCGGNSLNAMEAIGEIEKVFGVVLRISDLYTCRNVADLEEYLREILPQDGEESCFYALEKAPLTMRYPLTPIQQGIFVQYYLDSSALAYNMPGIFALAKKPDADRLQKAFRKLIAYDKIFSASFVQDNDGLWASIGQNPAWGLEILQGADLAQASQEFLRPFDLGQAPLLRAGLFEDKDGRSFLFLDTHHIISDGMSTPLFLSRLDRFYQNQEQEDLAFDYFDYAYALSQGHWGDKADNFSYWQAYLADMPEDISVPTDFPRPHIFDFHGDIYSGQLSAELTAKCENFCLELGVSAYTLFMAVYGIFLANLSGKKDFLLGMPVSGRLSSQMMEICGPFLNTLPLRIKLDRNQDIKKYISAIAENINSVLDHQGLSLEELMELCGVEGGLGSNPLYQIMLSMRPLDAESFTLDGEKMSYLPIATGTAKMELTLEIAKEGDHYGFYWEYAKSLFRAETIAFYGRAYQAILQAAISNPQAKVVSLPLMSIEDRISLIERPNHLFMPYLNMPLHKIIEGQILLAPNKTAFISGGKAFSYQQLGEMSHNIACLLQAHQGASGDKIGIALYRNENLLPALLGIIKAGCAYVPILSSFPAQRLEYMIENAEIKMILTDRVNQAAFPDDLSCPLLLVEDCRDLSAQEKDLFVEPVSSVDDLLHILYTSGSTGQPKGVMLNHRPLTNLLEAIRSLLGDLEGNILCTTNIMFDTFITENLLPLAMGKTVVVANDEEMVLPWEIARLIKENNITMMQFTPSRLQLCLSNDLFCRAAADLQAIILVG